MFSFTRARTAVYFIRQAAGQRQFRQSRQNYKVFVSVWKLEHKSCSCSSKSRRTLLSKSVTRLTWVIRSSRISFRFLTIVATGGAVWCVAVEGKHSASVRWRRDARLRGGLLAKYAPTRNNFVAKKNKKKKKNHLEIVFGTTLRRSANFYAKIDKVEN